MNKQLEDLKDVETFDAEVEVHGGEPYAVWAPALNGSHVKTEKYYALLAELESAQQRIAELERYAKERDAENESLALTVGKLRAKLATPVRLPQLCGDGDNDTEYTEGLNDGITQSAIYLRRHGFKVEGDE